MVKVYTILQCLNYFRKVSHINIKQLRKQLCNKSEEYIYLITEEQLKTAVQEQRFNVCKK